MELVIGRVARAHGVRGELVVEVRTDEPEQRFAPGSVLHARSSRGTADYTVAAARAHSGRLLLRLDEVGDRAAAEALRGCLFVVDAAELPPTDDPDAFYDHELEGLAVVLTDGTAVGTVTEVLHTAGGELLAVRDEQAEHLIPFVAAIVTVVDRAAGTIVIDPPAGLLER